MDEERANVDVEGEDQQDTSHQQDVTSAPADEVVEVVSDETVEDASVSTSDRARTSSGELSLEDVREVVTNALDDYDKRQAGEFDEMQRQLNEVGRSVLVLSDAKGGSSSDETGSEDVEVAEAEGEVEQDSAGYALDSDQWAVIHDGVRVVATCAVYQLVMVAALGGLVAWSIVSRGWRRG